MKRLLLLALVCVLTPLAGRAQTAVSGNLKDVGVANASGSNTYVRFTLIDYGAQIPRIINVSGNMIFSPIKDFKPDANGNISGTIQGNDTISPAATKYQVCIYYQGAQFRCNTYLINGATFNLNTATPLNTSVQAGANQLIVLSFPFTQATPASTWTIPHSFNDPNVYVQVFDTTHKIIYPDGVNTSDPNNAVLTFITPTAGFAIAMHAGSINIATNQPNAIISNPLVAQIINGQLVTFGGPVNIQGLLTTTGGQVHNSFEQFSSGIGAGNINGVLAVDGTQYATLAAAFTACPAVVCTIDMRGNGNAAALNLGTFDPGTTAVTILLGPYSYTLTQMTVRSGLHLIGTGPQGTTITQANPALAPFILPLSGTYPANVAVHCLFKGFNLLGAPSSTTDGFSMIAHLDVAGINGGIWYSRWEDLNIQSMGRSAVRLDTSVGNLTAALNGANQFLSFQDVFAFRLQNNPNPVLHITGSYNGQISFNNCQFDGQYGLADTVGNIYNVRIDDGGDNWLPYSIYMQQVTIQWAQGIGSAGIYLGGDNGFTCDTCHFEGLNGIVKMAAGSGGHGSWTNSIRNSYSDDNTGKNGSSTGFWVNTDGNGSLTLDNDGFSGTPNISIVGPQQNIDWRMSANYFGGSLHPYSNVNLGGASTVANLPTASQNAGQIRYVGDSTAIASEGQTCAGGSSNKALAFSNGAVWKCF